MLTTIEKLEILSDAAKYDASCSSSGSIRKNNKKGIGNSSGMGICHSYTPDGRCVSLLKILYTNYCIYDCSYCISRRSNDNIKTAFTVNEVIDLTINFYRRNYIEGLFLSSGIFKNADYTMERLVKIAKELRTKHHFNGYIHLKTIPGASQELIYEAGLYADRLSVNIELPSESSLQKLAPEKNYAQVFQPMDWVKKKMNETKEEKKSPFVPAGQTTQMIVGASPESDFKILQLANSLYKDQALKRVYYSTFIPVSNDTRLPQNYETSLIRENRLYQADWLMRDYGFLYSELLNRKKESLDMDIDPKLSFALENLHLFPIEINKVDYQMLIRVPGIGLTSADKIIQMRKHTCLSFDQLKKIGVALNRAQYFITCNGKRLNKSDLQASIIKKNILKKSHENNSLKNQTSILY